MPSTGSRYIIDPPSPFSPVGEWRDFLAEMETLDQDDPGVKDAIAEARRMIDAGGA